MAREVVEVITPATTDDLPEGASNKYDTGAPATDLADLDPTASTKLAGIEESADANIGEEFSTAEQTKLAGVDAGAEVNPTALETQTAIVALPDADRVLVGSEPLTDEKKIYGIHRNAAGNLELDSEDTPEA